MKQTNLIALLGILSVLVFIIGISSVTALTVDSVSVSPKEVAPGEIATIDVIVENNLNEDFEDVSVSLDLSNVPFAPEDSSTEKTVGEIREDKSKTFSFDVRALTDAESGIYKIPLKISYFDTNGEKQPDKTSLISMTVNSKPLIDVEIVDGVFLKGQKTDLTVKIVNKGLSNIKFLEVELGNSNYFSLLSSKKLYVGDVDSDDFETVDFEVFFKDSMPTNIKLPVTLRYKDITTQEYEGDFLVDMKVYSTEQALSLGLITKSRTSLLIGITVAVIVFYLVYRTIKRRRKRKLSLQQK